MGFTVKIQMLGLCHFVENSGDGAVKLAAILPDLSADQVLGPKHQPRLIYYANHLQTPPDPPYTRLRSRPLIRERVTFRFVPADCSTLDPPSLSPSGGTVRMSEIAQGCDTGLDGIVSPTPPDIVAAQAFFEQGQLMDSLVGSELEIPHAQDGNSEQRMVPGFVYVEVKNLSSVEVYIREFKNLRNGPYETMIFQPLDDSEVLALTITADCSLVEGSNNLPPRVEGTLDRDFAAHYGLLSKSAHDDLARRVMFRSLFSMVRSMFRDPEERLSNHVPKLKSASTVLSLNSKGEIVPNVVTALGGSDCLDIIGSKQNIP